MQFDVRTCANNDLGVSVLISEWMTPLNKYKDFKAHKAPNGTAL